MSMLASDVANPAFVGPINPDSALSVEFYWCEPEDPYKSAEAGKLIRLPKQPYVRIQQPGDHTSVIEVAVTERHKARFPDKWLYFQIANNMIEGAAEIPGWKIDEWTHLTPEQVRELKFQRFTVVEQVANASDGQCQRMGMGGNALREAARLALRSRLGVELKQEMDAKDAKISALEVSVAKFEAFMAASGQADKPPLKADRGRNG